MLPGGPGRIWIFSPFVKRRGDEPENSGNRGLAGLVASFFYQLTTLYGIGAIGCIKSLLLLLSLLPAPAREHVPVLFWLLAGLTLVSAVATISMHSPVYCAIWFAMTLLGTGGLFFLQGAQFLGVATVVVYAGAILVTFLFVLMLAQPEGHAPYDRLGWGWGPAAFASLAGVVLAALVVFQITGYQGASATKPGEGVLQTEHVAALGAQVVTRYLIPLEVAGTLLLVALVGAVAIAIQGKDLVPQEGRADE
jgi:NADH-quinone oxidoreductase subunit J